MLPRILFNSYGHTRAAGDDTPRNSVILTNYGALQGCKKVGDVVDISPTMDAGGVDWAAMNSAPERVVPADALYCQASVSLAVMRRFRELCPTAPIILQRDSTHCRTHLRLMKEAMQRHGIAWEHQYEQNGHSLVRHEEEEYDIADKIFVLSRWVLQSFLERESLRDKVVQFSSQLAQAELWGPPAYGWAGKGPRLTACSVGQTGLRKGTLDLLQAWREHFAGRHPGRLIICGLPESGAPEALTQRLRQEYARTPGCETMGWVDIRSMRAVYAQCHLLVSASVEEGSTMPGVEAMLCGVPVAATPNSGVDLVHHGFTGWEFGAGDTSSLREVLRLAEAALASGTLATMGALAQRSAAAWDVEGYATSCASAVRTVVGA